MTTIASSSADGTTVTVTAHPSPARKAVNYIQRSVKKASDYYDSHPMLILAGAVAKAYAATAIWAAAHSNPYTMAAYWSVVALSAAGAYLDGRFVTHITLPLLFAPIYSWTINHIRSVNAVMTALRTNPPANLSVTKLQMMIAGLSQQMQGAFLLGAIPFFASIWADQMEQTSR